MLSSSPDLFFFAFAFGTTEMLMIGVVGLILFGRRLPEVGRSLGKTFFELKRGMADIKTEFDDVERMAADAAREAEWKAREASHAETDNTEDDHFVDPHAYLREDEEIVREAQAFGEHIEEDEAPDPQPESDQDKDKKSVNPED